MNGPGVQIAAHGQTSATTRLWRFKDHLRVTIIVKATFTLVHQALMKLGPPDPILRKDVHQGNNPVRSVRLTDDLAPYLPGTDVLLTGHAHAPPGARAKWVTAGIALYDKYELVFEKYLDVRGDPGPDGITPFQKMPLVWERTFGGPGWEDNPFGVGAGGSKGEPNIYYVGERGRSAGFAPLSAHWPARKRLVPPGIRKSLTRPIAEIPEGFDWSYFHAAPHDQRCAFLGGSEWLVLQGLHPEERRVRSRLPAVKGLARVFWAGEPGADSEPLELTADTLRIDSDRGTCSLTWRKSFAVWEEAQLADVAIVAAVQLGEHPVKWPTPPPIPRKAVDASAAVRPVALPVPLPAATAEPVGATTVDDDDDQETVSVRDRPDAPDRGGRSEAAKDPALRESPAPAPVVAAEPPTLPFAAESLAPAAAPRPMVLGSFRLAVFSPKYEEDPDDPLLSTLVIGARRPRTEPGRSTAEPARGTGSFASSEDSSLTTLVMEDSPSPTDADSMATTLVIRARPSPAATATDTLPETGLRAKIGPAGTIVLLDSPDEEPESHAAPVPPHGPDQQVHARPRGPAHRGGALRRSGSTPAAPRFPKPPGARLELTDLAAVAAALAETGAPRAEVLSAHDLSEVAWIHDEKRWSAAFRDAARRGDRGVIDAFDGAYVAAWEAIRGAVTPADYACLSVSSERGDRSAMLAALRVTSATWRRVRHVWARRMVEEPALAQAVREAESALR